MNAAATPSVALISATAIAYASASLPSAAPVTVASRLPAEKLCEILAADGELGPEARYPGAAALARGVG